MSRAKSPINYIINACMGDDPSEEDIRLAKEIIHSDDDDLWELVSAASLPVEDIDSIELQEILGENGISDVVICRNCGSLMDINVERCPVCKKKNIDKNDPWSLYRSVSHERSGKDLIFMNSNYEDGKHIFLERIISPLYVRYRVIEIQMIEKMRSPVVRIYEDRGMKGGV